MLLYSLTLLNSDKLRRLRAKVRYVDYACSQATWVQNLRGLHGLHGLETILCESKNILRGLFFFIFVVQNILRRLSFFYMGQVFYLGQNFRLVRSLNEL